MDLTCPKCHGPMRSYERSGITVDQCGECRGVFLDRGELDKLIDAEGAVVAPRPPAPSPQHPVEPLYPRDERRYDQRYEYGSDPRSKGRRKRSFLEDLFD